MKKVIIEIPVEDADGDKIGFRFEHQVGQSFLKAIFVGINKGWNKEYCLNTSKFLSEDEAYKMTYAVGKMLATKS